MPSSLIRHEQIHRNEKRYKCATCGGRFNDPSTYNKHMVTHTGTCLLHTNNTKRKQIINHILLKEWLYSCFSLIRDFLQNHGRILPGLTYTGSQPLNVNTGRKL